MLKLTASLSKKLPIEGVEFSSRSASAGIEVEMPSSASPEEVGCRIQRLYDVLESAVDDQLGSPHQVPGQWPNNDRPNGNGSGRQASQSQLKAIRAIAEDRGLTGHELHSLVDHEFQAGTVLELSMRQASTLIDILKNNGEYHR